MDPRMRLLLSRSPGGVKARETPQAAENGLGPTAPRPGSEGGASGLHCRLPALWLGLPRTVQSGLTGEPEARLQDSLHEPSFQELKVRTRPVRVWLCPAQGGVLGAFPFLSSRLALMEKCLTAQCVSVSACAHEPSRRFPGHWRKHPRHWSVAACELQGSLQVGGQKMGSVPFTYLLKCNASQSCIWSSTLPCLGEHSCDVSHHPCSSPLWKTLALVCLKCV